ncbi:glycoside hydrolase [Cristinia sonorae]|uniref:Glycoside hydrolase n=1 Tax=Cristinia sonorae TaxID=1940300 RepID=A0A8K0UN12_9AGAR|nr:glycoside hydrolase [Cristinia sonorae]
MPKVPSVSPATGKPVSPHYIHTLESSFVDNAGRTLLLRGVNLSGSDKAPVGCPSQILDGFWETAESGGESFVGRPLNLEDGSADVHLARLKGWGFNMLRYVVTWEALEHAGPGKYDHEFMDYTIRVLRKCKEYGFKVLMDPHQDTWSRFSGGSGAPYWTLIACGINPRNITPTQAAIIHSEYPNASNPNPAELPAMIWSTNYGRLAIQTLFTLFFAGADFAPKCVIDGVNIQDYLQSHYISAIGQLADRIRDAGDLLEECVLGWDSMNEPFEGFCGYPDLNSYPSEQTSTLKKGTFPTPAQSLRLGMGKAQTLDTWTVGAFGPKKTGRTTVDPKGVKLWLDASAEPEGVHPVWGWRRDPGWKLGTCLWALHGVWDVETGYVITPDYFKFNPAEDREVCFIEDYWRKHWQAFGARIRQSHPEAILFVAPPVFAQPPTIEESDLKGRCCLSTHYYDGLTLITRHWHWFNADALGILRGKYSSNLPAVKFGERAIRKSLQEQLGILKDDAKILGAYPTLIGEIGTPMDMDDKKSYGWTDKGKYKGDYSNQQKALDASLNATDGPNALNYTIWTYCPDSTHAWGDGWNMEDLSLWSPDDLRDRPDDRFNIIDASSAMLLKRPPVNPISRSAATSSVSLATFSGPNVPEEDPKAALHSAMSSLSYWDNAYDFLTDGARAVKAFSRPYPSAVIGVPKDIQFDISKAEFRFTVVVRPEDAPSAPLPPPILRMSSESSTLVDSEAAEKAQDLATEIFIPLVHYASDREVARSNGQQQEDSDSASIASGSSAASSSDPTPYGTVRATQAIAIASSLTLKAAWYSASGNTLNTPLSLDVDVSVGQWTLEGQTLRWWYPVPAVGEPPREYTIIVRRAGGAIKSSSQAEGGGFWSDVCGTLSRFCAGE